MRGELTLVQSDVFSELGLAMRVFGRTCPELVFRMVDEAWEMLEKTGVDLLEFTVMVEELAESTLGMQGLRWRR